MKTADAFSYERHSEKHSGYLTHQIMATNAHVSRHPLLESHNNKNKLPKQESMPNLMSIFQNIVKMNVEQESYC